MFVGLLACAGPSAYNIHRAAMPAAREGVEGVSCPPQPGLDIGVFLQSLLHLMGNHDVGIGVLYTSQLESMCRSNTTAGGA